MFKIGDRVRCGYSYMSSDIKAGDTGVVIYVSYETGVHRVRVDRTGYETNFVVGSKRWEVIMKKKKKDSKYLYTFTTSPDNVDYDKVYEDSVSGDKPLAVLKIKGEDKCVAIVHESIERKAWAMKDAKMIVPSTGASPEPELLYELHSLGACVGDIFFTNQFIDPKHMPRIKEIVKEIHHAKWEREPTRISVQQVDV